jgi:GTP-binding protein
MVFRPGIQSGYEIEHPHAGVFCLSGPAIERLIERFDLENVEAVSYVETRLRRLGVLGALRAKGFEPGDEVRIGDAGFALFASAKS